MIEAKRIRDEWSTDGLVPTGAVIVKNGKIIGRAANQSALKNWKLRDFHKNTFCIRRALKVPTGTRYWMCPGCASHRHHAESRSIKDAEKRHGSVKGADLYLYGHWWCCKPCWDAMIQAGIRNVYLAEGSAEQFKRAPKGKFIAIEGGEGSGKSSLLLALKEEFGDRIVTTREPGGSPYAEHIRAAALKNPLAKTAPAETTLCLMFAARYDNATNLIEPALKSGKPVIADRFDGSSYAYQVGGQSGGKFEQIFWNLRKHLSIVPDVYIFIDVDPKEGIRRAGARNQSLGLASKYDHFDDRELEFHERVRHSYLKFLKKVPHIRIDANRPLEHVKRDFVNTIRELIL
jgi:dTMP kinase